MEKTHSKLFNKFKYKDQDLAFSSNAKESILGRKGSCQLINKFLFAPKNKNYIQAKIEKSRFPDSLKSFHTMDLTHKKN